MATPEQLKGILESAEASERMRAITSGEEDALDRSSITRVVMDLDATGKCLAKFMTLPDRARHDARLDLAALADVNGWRIPDAWAVEDPCLASWRR